MQIFKVHEDVDVTKDHVTSWLGQFRDDYVQVKRKKETNKKVTVACFIVVMGHGSAGVVESSKGEKMDVHETIITPFNNKNCPKFENLPKIPKIFIMNCCR